MSQFFTRFGVPIELHSDQGQNFEAEAFQEACRLLGIYKTRTILFIQNPMGWWKVSTKH